MNGLEELERLAAQATPGPWEVGEFAGIHNGFEGVATAYAGNSKMNENAAYIVAACNAVPSLIARLRGQEFKNSHLSNLVEGLEEHTDILQTKVFELEKQRDFLANCLLKQEKCFMPQEFDCYNRTPYGHYCRAESYRREVCIWDRAEEAGKEAE